MCTVEQSLIKHNGLLEDLSSPHPPGMCSCIHVRFEESLRTCWENNSKYSSMNAFIHATEINSFLSNELKINPWIKDSLVNEWSGKIGSLHAAVYTYILQKNKLIRDQWSKSIADDQVTRGKHWGSVQDFGVSKGFWLDRSIRASEKSKK